MLFIGRAVAELNGIIYAQPIADIVSVIIATGMFLVNNRNFKKIEATS
jgi:hypothetical protein